MVVSFLLKNTTLPLTLFPEALPTVRFRCETHLTQLVSFFSSGLQDLKYIYDMFTVKEPPGIRQIVLNSVVLNPLMLHNLDVSLV